MDHDDGALAQGRTLGLLEGRVRALEEKTRTLEDWMKSIDGKVDQLLAAANMGRGAWAAALRIGGLMVLGAGACAWLYDHFPKLR